MNLVLRTFFCLCIAINFTLQAQTDSNTYKQSPLDLKTKTGKLYGTLTLPANSKGRLPLVLIIAGSGPTDRDCNNPVMKNDAYKKLAIELANNQIASLRYDKRGIAASREAGKSEKDLRFTDYVNDVIGWIDFLNSDKRFSEIIVLGHSEGSLIGMLASRSGVSKYISVAGLSQSADKLLKEQLETMPDDLRARSFSIIDSLVAGKEVKNTPSQLGSLFRSSVQPYLISWFKENPVQAIAELKIPLLIVHGTADLQVKPEEARLLAAANPRAHLLIIENMNHVLRTITGGQGENMESYYDAGRPLSSELVPKICAFIRQN